MAVVRCLGMAVVDFVFELDAMPRRAEKHVAKTARQIGGGGGANAAAAIAKLGGVARLCGRLGEDAIGEAVRGELEALGVDCVSLEAFPGAASCFSSVYLDPAGERQIVSFRGAGFAAEPDFLGRDDRPYDAALADTRWREGAMWLMEDARRRGAPAVVDGEAPADPDVFRRASHIAFSRQGLRALTGAMPIDQALIEAGRAFSAWLCVTDGENGVYWLDRARGSVENRPAHAVTAVDTLGAGDVWHGAFALALAEGADEIAAIDFASAAGGLKCARRGGRETYPDRGAVEALLGKRN